MKLVVNVAPIAPPLAGIGRYSRYLLAQLMSQQGICDLSGITPFKALDRQQLQQRITDCDNYALLQSEQSANNSIKRHCLRLMRYLPFSYPAKRLLEHYGARRHQFNRAETVYWEPSFLLLPIDLPSILTVYDLSHLSHPQYHPPARVKQLETHLERNIGQASRIVTISAFSKGEIIQAFGTDAHKISIVPPAVDDSFRLPVSAASLANLHQRYQLPQQFMLSVCTLEPRKNLATLMRAFSALPSRVRKHFPLVLVGAKGWGDSELQSTINRLEQRGELIRLGYVSQQDLPLLYRAAQLLVYVSLYEGYGMPVAEAMASGTPVITANVTSMPEVAAGAALLVDPLDEQMIGEAIQQVLEDQVMREKLITAGTEKSLDYTWGRSADLLYDVMQGLC
ncbi:MAG: glycosyltransferase family 4 protein [Pseudomonadales bacterium]